MKKNIIITCILVLMLCVLFFSISDSDLQVAYASETQTIEERCALYTSRGVTEGVDIASYINEFSLISSIEYMQTTIGTAIPAGNCFQNNNTLSFASMLSTTINGDDYITNIIPRELFMSSNQYVYIGEKYGFFINTVYEDYRKGYESTIILFDVNISEISSQDYMLDIQIQPIYSMVYAYVTNTQTAMKIRNFANDDYNAEQLCLLYFSEGVSNAVIPIIRAFKRSNVSSITNYVQYAQSEHYLACDISFAASLYNVNSLNIGDTGYSVDEDYGYFFTGNSYHYSASHIESADVTSGIKNITSSITSAVLGYVPFLGDAISVADNLFTLASGVNALSSQITYNTTNENFVYPDLALYNTRATQKQHYNTLVKGSEILINSPDSERLYFLINDYVRGTFNFSHTDKADGSSAEYNQLKLTVAMKIYNADGGLVDYFISDNLVFDINAPSTTAMQLFDDADFYITPGGAQSFSFVPPYNAKYDFAVPTGCDLYVDNVKVTAQNGKYQKVLPAGQACAIELKNVGNTLAYGGWSIDVADSAASLSVDNTALPYSGLYMHKYTPSQSGVYNLVTSTNAKIDDIYTYNSANKTFNSVFSQETYVITENLDVFLSANTEYYIILDKTQDVTTNVTFNAASLTATLSVGTNTGISVNASDNFKFFKFVVPSGSVQDYSFIFTGMTDVNHAYDFRLLDQNANYVLVETLSNGYLKAKSLTPGATYYLGVKANIAKTFSVDITAEQVTTCWKIYENGILIHNSGASTVTLKNNSTYEVEFWINDAVKADVIQLDSDYLGSQGITINNFTGEIQISAERNDGTTFAIIGTASDDSQPFESQTLTVGVVYNENLVTLNQIDYVNKCLVSWTQYSDDSPSITYQISGTTETGTTFSSSGTVSGNSIDMLPYLVQQKALSNVVFSITSIQVPHGSNGNAMAQLSGKSISINCKYSHIESEKLIFSTITYYQIANELHLHNLRNDLGTRKRLDNDIEINNFTSWTPIPTFTGFLYGGGFKISGVSIFINSGNSVPQNIGFIGENNGGLSGLYLEDLEITSAEDLVSTRVIYVGGLVGTNADQGVIGACTVVGTITVYRTNSFVGGVVGYSNSQNGISECVFGAVNKSSTITGYGFSGGIIGYSSAIVMDCSVKYATINHYVASQDLKGIGGIVAFCDSTTISDSSIENSSMFIYYKSDHLRSDAVPVAGYILGCYKTDYNIDGYTVTNCTNNKNQVTNKSKCFSGSYGLYGGVSPEE